MLLLVGLLTPPAAGAVSGATTGIGTTSGEVLYQRACAACHGADGRGMPRETVGFATPLPDFTDCRFGPREPDADWYAVAHAGGPVRGFDRMMPAFGKALSETQLTAILGHVRTFCRSDAWPRGELNLPRALVTEKAFPEDELVVTTSTTDGDARSSQMEIVYEKRFGPRNQIEVAVPVSSIESGRPDGSLRTDNGVGDVGVAFKRALFHSHQRGAIFSLTGEVILPTGNEGRGLGRGYTVFEPFATFGKILPADAFLQFQAGFELPIDEAAAEDEAFLRGVFGTSWSATPFGRTWSPMLELLAKRELASGEDVLWDAVPQVQVTLNTRQHVMANFGVRLPLNRTQGRDTELLFYILWDWFDGGFLQGW